MKKLIAVLVAAALVAVIALIALPAVLLVGVSTLLSGTQAGGAGGVCVETGSPAPSVDTSKIAVGVEGMYTDQLANAAVVMQAGDEAGLGERAQLIGIMTAMQESTLINLSSGDRDSVGLFQQRPSQGWGTTAQLRNPKYAAEAFFRGVDTANGSHVPGLADISDWESKTLTEAAQAAQAVQAVRRAATPTPTPRTRPKRARSWPISPASPSRRPATT